MSDSRLIDIVLDADTIMWRSAEIEQERRVAISDLLEANLFRPRRAYPNDYSGPYRLTLRTPEGRLALDIAAEDGRRLETFIFAMGRFQRPIREYFAICESYFAAIRSGAGPQAIETIDMARRGIHNDAAEMLKGRLAEKIELDFDTARRLFTLICVLHSKG